MIAARLNDAPKPAKPALRIVEAPRPDPALRWMDTATRESHLKMIRHLARRHRLQILVDQATFGRYGLDDADDDTLSQLLRDMHTAIENAEYGVSLEESGLLRVRA